MNKEYNYYIRFIKPLEKKYNRINFFYSLFRFKFLNKKIYMYNLLLIHYYKKLQKNNNSLNEIKKEISHKKNNQ